VDHFWPKGYPVKVVQVAGTSGKGSTCQLIQSGLRPYGRAGCYVKPHVFDYSERFVVDGRQVPHEEIMTIWTEEIRPYCVASSMRGEPWELDHPEVSLLIAMRLFEKHALDWAAIETGIGGRYDPVSMLDVVATVLTNVGRDHEEMLGSEHWQRALEKAGICRPGIPLVLGDADKRTVEVVTAVCRDVGTPLRIVSPEDITELRESLAATRQRDSGFLLGSKHQMQNAAVAAMTVKMLVKRAKVETMLPKFIETRFVGRFWKVEKGVFADVAHNPSKTQALAEEAESRFPRRKKVFVIGISGKRNPVDIVEPLVPQARSIVVTAAGYKGQDPGKVHAAIRERFPSLPIQLVPDPQTTLKVAKNLRRGREVIIFTGSTYMIDQALNPDERLRHLNATYGWRNERMRKELAQRRTSDI
jgi:dihydrofolate synthase / folylpolyglutamate synthase